MLPLSFYDRPADQVAKELLGCTFCIKTEGVLRKARVVETEAYLGEDDLACHASKGRTKRTEVIFGPPAHAYVYLIYGMYDMFNIVTDKQGSAHAVLIRAVEPLENIEGKTDGPGKLCRAMKITREHNKSSCLSDELWFEAADTPSSITVKPRVGIDYAKDWKDAPLRFYDTNSKVISKY